MSIAWAAGLFEGEGCITLSNRGVFGSYAYLSLCMCDEDVVRRFHSVVGRGQVVGPYSYQARPDHYLPRWTWTCTKHADVGEVLAAFWPWLGERRRAKAHEVRTSVEIGMGSRRKPWKYEEEYNDMLAEQKEEG